MLIRSTLMLLLIIGSVGCETMGDKTKKGAGIGALTGAALGGIIGHQDGHGWEGALIGGAAGAALGGFTGNQMEKNQMASNPSYVSIVRVVELAQQGVPDGVIIDEITRSKSVYSLDSETIAYLKNNSVSDNVIDTMLSTM